MVALQNFVPGGSFPTETEDDWNRLCLLFMMASKLSRYCASYTNGGHPDSLDDNSVYAQMLNEIDREIQAKGDKKPAISSTELLKNLDTPAIKGAIGTATRHT